jgi:FKBP-type peptidyl-prolyl cis-trans isomerase
MRTRIAALLLGTALLTACGGDGGSDVASTETVLPTPEASTAPATPCEEAPPTEPARPSTSANLAQRPAVEGTDAPPPCGLVVRDVVVGTGAEVVPGAQVEVKYVGAFYETGEEFDSSWSRGPDETLPFVAGGGNLIPGFDQGVLGMKEGGRREIVIPSDLGYGPQGTGGIPGGSTLVFVIDVVTVTPAP